MEHYTRMVFYYETDKMGIVHHSNYIRWMEEARVHFLMEAGVPLTLFEERGITCPVAGVSCAYKSPARFGDTICVETTLLKYNGVKLEFSYIIRRKETGEILAEGSSRHGFLFEEKVCAVQKIAPDLHARFCRFAGIA